MAAIPWFSIVFPPQSGHNWRFRHGICNSNLVAVLMEKMMGVTTSQCSNTPSFHLGLASHHQLLFVALFIHLTLLLTDLLDMRYFSKHLSSRTMRNKLSHQLGTCIHMRYSYILVYAYITYTFGRDFGTAKNGVCVCIYIYIHTHIYIYISTMHREGERKRKRERGRHIQGTYTRHIPSGWRSMPPALPGLKGACPQSHVPC